MANTHSIDLEAGSSQYLSATDSASLSVTGNMTVEMWVKPESQPGTNASFGLVAKYVAEGNQRSYMIKYQDSAGTKRLQVITSADGSTVLNGTVDYTLSNGTWYHLAFVYTAASGQCEVFVDGTSVGTITGLSTSLLDGTAAFLIGNDDSNQYFDGLIDDVRLWSTVRTQAQIQDNRYTEIDSATGLEGSWHLNNALTDASGNSNTLTNNGTASFVETTHPQVVTVPAGTLALSGPTVTIELSQSITVPVGTLTISGPTVTITVTDNKISNLDKNSASFTNLDKS